MFFSEIISPCLASALATTEGRIIYWIKITMKWGIEGIHKSKVVLKSIKENLSCIVMVYTHMCLRPGNKWEIHCHCSLYFKGEIKKGLESLHVWKSWEDPDLGGSSQSTNQEIEGAKICRVHANVETSSVSEQNVVYVALQLPSCVLDSPQLCGIT